MKSKNMKRRLLGATVRFSLAAIILTAASAAHASGVITNSPNFPTSGSYPGGSTHLFYTLGGHSLDGSQVSLTPIPGTVVSTPAGANEIEQFSATFSEMVSEDGAPAFPFSGIETAAVTIFGYSPGTVGTFNMEMTQLDLPPTPDVIGRESPTLSSVGQMTITPIGGGMFHIDSFFDVFTEISIDGGATWVPDVNGPIHVQLTQVPEPSSVMLFAIGLVGLMGCALRRRRAAFALALLVPLTLLAADAQAAGVTYQDSTFNNANWTATKALDTTAGNAATFSAGQVTTGGDPGAFREVTHNLDPGRIVVAHLLAGTTYNPSTQGAISAVSFSDDLIGLNEGGVTGYTLLLFQNGSYYGTGAGGVAGDDAIGQGTWQHFSHVGLTALNFANYSPLGTGGLFPDFSSTGAPIQIGYMSTNTESGGFGTTTTGIDNFAVSITSVPEPCSAVLVIVACGTLCWWRKRFK
jgi:hypothetical protein